MKITIDEVIAEIGKHLEIEAIFGSEETRPERMRAFEDLRQFFISKRDGTLACYVLRDQSPDSPYSDK